MPNTTKLLPHQLLRAATQADHERIDAAFGRYDLADRSTYGAFLQAHARIVPSIERDLIDFADLPPFEPRTPALTADLAELGCPFPETMPGLFPQSIAEAWGIFYVLEGSRLGGVMIARSIPSDMPKAYLSAAHARGNWRTVLASFDAAAGDQDDVWTEEAVLGARRTFARYEAASRG